MIFFQISVFALTFLTYSAIHATRQGWAFLKTSIKEEEPPGVGLSSGEIGVIDSAFYVTYGLCLFVSGSLADRFS